MPPVPVVPPLLEAPPVPLEPAPPDAPPLPDAPATPVAPPAPLPGAPPVPAPVDPADPLHPRPDETPATKTRARTRFNETSSADRENRGAGRPGVMVA
jgi:hypothetical protein